MPPQLIALITTYRYAIILPLLFVEGPTMSLIMGFLVSLGLFEIVPTYLMLILGDVLPDTTFYCIGRFGHGHRIFRKLEDRLTTVEHFWHNHTFQSMIIAKWAYGLSMPLLATAGLSRLPYRKFLTAAIPITMAQYAILMMLGYEFGASYRLISKTLLDAGIFIASCVVLAAVFFAFFGWMAKKKLSKLTAGD